MGLFRQEKETGDPCLQCGGLGLVAHRAQMGGVDVTDAWICDQCGGTGLVERKAESPASRGESRAVTDPRTREREALEAAHNALATAVITSNGYARDKFTSDEEETASENAHAAIIAYGRAVREADKEAALGRPPAQTGSTDKYNAAWISGNWKGRREAAAAIEALGKE